MKKTKSVETRLSAVKTLLKTQRALVPMMLVSGFLVAHTVPSRALAQIEDLRFPGAMCQPESDEDDVTRFISYRAANTYDATCPIINYLEYPPSTYPLSIFQARVFDGSTSQSVLVSACRNTSDTSAAMSCGPASSSGTSFSGWTTLSPIPPATGTNANVWTVFVDQLPGNSHVLWYRVFRP